MKIKSVLITIISLVVITTIALCVVLATDILNPTNRQIKLGYKYLTEGNYEAAVLSFNKAIEINPNEMASYLAIVNVYEELEDNDKAYIYMTKMFRALVAENAEITFSNKYTEYIKLFQMKNFDEIFETWYVIALADSDREELRDMVKAYLLRLDNEKYNKIIDEAVKKYRENRINDLLENGYGSTYSAGSIKYTYKNPQWWNGLYETDGMMDNLYVYHKNSRNSGYDGILFAITENEPIEGFESELIENDLGVVYYWNVPIDIQTGDSSEEEYNKMKTEIEFIKETFVIADDSPMGKYTNGDYVTLTGKLMYVNNQNYYDLITDKRVDITHHDADGMGFGTTGETHFRVVSYTDLSEYNGKKVKVSGNLDGVQRGKALNIYDYSIYDAIVEFNE